MQVVSVDEMRAIEQRAATEYGLTTDVLMRSAGRSIAEILRTRLGGDVVNTSILMLVGPGNNGGDGRVAAGHLAEWGAHITSFIWKERRLEDGASVLSVGDDLRAVKESLAHADVVLDALLGTGHARALDPSMRDVLAAVGEERARRPTLLVVSVDLPTGLDADSGAIDPGTLAADLTVTLAFPKRGMLLFPGASYIGELEVGDIGLPADMPIDVTLDLMTPEIVRGLLPARPLDSNKGTFGKAMIMAGSMPYPGSAFLAATAAGRVGAGLVTLAVTPDLAPIYAVKLSETTFLPLPDASGSPVDRARALLDGLHGYAALLIGPGLGQADDTRAFLMALFDGLRTMPASSRPRLVVDADGLNHLARAERWWELLPPHTVITPHPGEITRLRGGSHVSGGGADRLDVVRWAAEWGHVIVLKGGCTLVASPDGRMRINWPPNPALATAGTGDVLAGAVVGFLAQGANPFDAASSAVFTHARAGLAVSDRLGDAGLLASDLLPELPSALRDTRTA